MFILFYSTDLLAPPFNFNQSLLLELRNSLLNARDCLPTHIANDGGSKVKISSDDPNVFSSLDSYLLLKPLLRILHSFTTPEVLSFLFRYLLFQSFTRNDLDIDQLSKINLVVPPSSLLHRAIFNHRSSPNDPYEGIQHLAWSSKCPTARKLIAPWLSKAVLGDWRKSLPSDSLNLIPRFHVSYLDPGSFIRPHLDHPSKILSLMLYLPTSIQEDCIELGTAFHTPSIYNDSNSIVINEHNRISDFNSFSNDFNTMYSSFSSSRLILFAPSNNSWHSFEYPKNVDIGTRVSININYHLLGDV